MDNNLIFVPSKAEDVYELTNKLRAEDVMECQAAGHTPAEALMNGYTYSEICLTAKVKGKAEAMFGVCSVNQPKGFGVVWYLGSNESFNYPISLVKKGRKYVKEWLKKYTVLFNCVDKRNVRHIEWLKRLGFTFTQPITMPSGYEFLQFYKTR